jgi:cytochrome c peroxidase
MKKRLLVIGLLSLLLFAFRSADMFLDIPESLGKPVYDFKKKPLTIEKVELGRKLFYDPILSKNNQVSCANCHSSYNAFAHIDHQLSHGINDIIGTRNAPALMNLAWQSSFMWDGAVNHIEVQPLAPISNPIEMDETIEHVVEKLQHTSPYPQLFFVAFGDSVITGERVLLAMAQFQLTLISANSKYDSVIAGTSIFTVQEEKGYKLFQQNCSSCHKEPLMSNYEFRNNGLAVDTMLNDFGRMGITHNTKDSLLFKVPTLRNIEYTYPYMHDGRFKSLNQVMNHYTSGVVHSRTLSAELNKPIQLSSNDKIDLIAFLLTLSDRTFVFNKNFAYPSPNNSLPRPKDKP